MLKGTFSKILLVSALIFCVLPMEAQDEAYNAYSPYSMFGIGDISKAGTPYNKSMGGVGIASRDNKFLNILNPASVTARDKKTFMLDIGIAQGNRYYTQDQLHSSNNTFNIYDVAFSFPVWKSLAVYGGFTPYSDLGYKISSRETDQNIISHTGAITNTVLGYGGLSNVFIGGGFNVFKGLSVGGEFDYIFGSLHKDNTYYLSESTYRNISSGYNIQLNAATAKFGVQYETPLFGNISAVFGATYKLKADLKGEVGSYEIQTISSVNDSTPSPRSRIDNIDGKIKLSDEIGLGLSIRGGDRWTAEANYFRSDWSGSGLDKVAGFAVVGNAVFSATKSQSIRAGFSFTPNRNDIRYYRKRITYRAGTYYDQAHFKVAGNDINAFGLTFGATFPIYSNRQGVVNGLTFGIDVGQRGTTNNNLVRERYVNFNIGLSICDIWFLKPRYD